MFSSTLTVVQSSRPSDDSLVLRPPALSFTAWPCHSRTLSRPLDLDRSGLAPSTPIVTPFHKARFQLGLSSRAPPDSTKRTRSTRSIWTWHAFMTIYSTLHVLQRGHYERCSSRDALFSCLQLGSFASSRASLGAVQSVSFVKQQDIISSPSIMKLSLSFIHLCMSQAKTVALSCRASLKLGT